VREEWEKIWAGNVKAIRTDAGGAAGAYWMNNAFVSLSVNINS